MTVDDVLSRLEGVRRSGSGWVALCPCHEDREPSLSIGEGDDGRLLLKCFAGCSWDALRGALDLDSSNGSSPVEVARYHYLDEKGRELYSKIRFVPKRFIREPKGVTSSLYRLELLPQASGALLFLSESEKDADAALGLGAELAVSSGGASTWREGWSDRIARAAPRCVAILQHHDDAGKKFSARVAASLSKRGLSVRVLSFPGAEGYDVADAIRDGLTLDELLTRAESEPKWIPHPVGKAAEGLALQTLGDLLNMPAETTSWVWEGRIPSGGLAGLFAKPKGGKSTLARCLALAVSRGEPFLGFPTSQGAVIYLGLEEKPHEVQAHFRSLGARPEDPIHVLLATAPIDGLARLRLDVERLRPALVIIDTLSRLVRLKDGNDYAEVTRELEAVLCLARETGAAVLFVHHLGKGERSEAGDQILGSTAILASVDTALMLRRTERYRTLSSVQRYGSDLEEITLQLDPETRGISDGGTRAEADEVRYSEEILARMAGVSEELSEKEVLEPIEGRLREKRAALQGLVGKGKILREGAGKKGDPYRYANSFPRFPVYTGKSGNESVDQTQPVTEKEKMLFPNFRVGEGNESDPGKGISDPPKGDWREL